MENEVINEEVELTDEMEQEFTDGKGDEDE